MIDRFHNNQQAILAAGRVSRALLGHNPDHKEQAETIVGLIPTETATALVISDVARLDDPQKGMLYLSTPITGGKRLYEFLDKVGKHSKKELTEAESAAYKKEVIAANCSHADQIADALRGRGEQVFAPAEIGIPGWDQSTYNKHWMKCMQQLPLTGVTLCDGWQLSYGCLLEARTAYDRGLPVTDERGQELSRDQALEIVLRDARRAEQQGFHVGEIGKVLTAPLDSLPLEL